jgi:hypothetical protein
MLRVTLFFILLLNGSILQAQKIDKKFKMHLSQMNLVFEMPKGYIETDSTFDFNCGDRKQNNGILYCIMKADSSLKIAFCLNNYPEPIEISRIKQLNPKWTPEANYLKIIYQLADTIHYKLLFYPEKYVKEKFNADDGGELTRNCTIAIEKKYTNNRMIFAAKKQRGYIQLTYMYTDEARKTIDKEMQETACMLQFKE